MLSSHEAVLSTRLHAYVQPVSRADFLIPERYIPSVQILWSQTRYGSETDKTEIFDVYQLPGIRVPGFYLMEPYLGPLRPEM